MERFIATHPAVDGHAIVDTDGGGHDARRIAAQRFARIVGLPAEDVAKGIELEEGVWE